MHRKSIQIYRTPRVRVTLIASWKVLESDPRGMQCLKESMLIDSSFIIGVDAQR